MRNVVRIWSRPLAWIATISGLFASIVIIAVWYAIVFPRQPFTGPLPPPTDEDIQLGRRLNAHITAIASRPRNLRYYKDLEAAATYIEHQLHGYGYAPSLQEFVVEGRPVRNIEVEIAPRDSSAQSTIIVGGHYDSPDDSPGANDNGTGVAAALELARLLSDLKPTRTRLRLVFWVNEEHPYGKTPAMGSWQHAKRLSESGEKIQGAIALETLGYFSNQPGSQKFPWPFGMIYPDRGNFIAFVGLPGSRSFVHKAIGAFRSATPFPSIGGVAPGFLEGIDLSDHWAYDQFGFPALMVTDTAPFRNPRYHTLDDLPDTVDYESLARVTAGLERMLRVLVRQSGSSLTRRSVIPGRRDEAGAPAPHRSPAR